MKLSDVKSLVNRSKDLYPTSNFMRKQWIKSTINLIDSGRHVLITGKWKGK